MILLNACKDQPSQPIAEASYLSVDDFPAWSPDGKWIAYYHKDYENDSTYKSGLYLIDTARTARTLLVLGFASAPDWSPDGSWVLFSGGSTIWKVKKNGDSLTYLTWGNFARWSPDGGQIGFDRSGTQDTVGIWINHLSNNVETRIGYGAQPAWSPNGNRFVYGGGPSTLNSVGQIWIMDSSGSNRVQFTYNQFKANRFPRWSSNGAMIIWSVLISTDYEAWIASADGSNQHRVTIGKAASFSPDSRTIVISKINLEQTKLVIWTIDLSTSMSTQLTF